MNDMPEVVRRALAEVVEPIEPRPTPSRRTLNRARARRAAAAAVTGSVLAAVTGVAAWGVIASTAREPAERRTSPVATEGPRLYVVGNGEVWSVGLDGDTRHVQVPELNPGDPPHFIVSREGRLVAWGYETYLVDPELESPPRELVGDSLFFIPSDHADRVWIATPDEERASDGLIATVREVTTDGEVTFEDVRPPGGGWPEGAVTDGLIFFQDGERVVWEPITGEIVYRFRPDDLGATHGNLVSWCDEGCRELHVTNVRTGEDRTIDPPVGFGGFRVTSGAFSPDGRTIAVPVRPEGESSEAHLALVDLETGTARTLAGSETGEHFNLVAWDSLGEHVFFSGGAETGPRTIVVYRRGDDAARVLDADVGQFYDAAAL